jgi:hypothetical protein
MGRGEESLEQKKHGINFRDAIREFGDPLMLLLPKSGGGRGYQTRMNAILRREMLQARASGTQD